MIPLFKIRYKYLKRHPCSMTFGYLFIPTILISIFFIASIIKAIIIRGERKNRYNYYDDYYSSSSIKQNNPYEYDLNNLAIIVNEIKNGEKLSQFIKKKTNVKLDYFHENQKNQILKKYNNIIIYKEEKGSHTFDIKINHKLINFNISKIFNNLKFSKLKKKFVDFIYINHTTKNKTNKINNLKSLISKYIENDKNIKNFSIIPINS